MVTLSYTMESSLWNLGVSYCYGVATQVCFSIVWATVGIGPCSFGNFANPPPPFCTSTGLSQHGVGVEPLFSEFFGTAYFLWS